MAFHVNVKEDSDVSKLDPCRLLTAVLLVQNGMEPARSEFWLSGLDIEQHEDVSNNHGYTVGFRVDSGVQILKASIQSMVNKPRQ